MGVGGSSICLNIICTHSASRLPPSCWGRPNSLMENPAAWEQGTGGSRPSGTAAASSQSGWIFAPQHLPGRRSCGRSVSRCREGKKDYIGKGDEGKKRLNKCVTRLKSQYLNRVSQNCCFHSKPRRGHWSRLSVWVVSQVLFISLGLMDTLSDSLQVPIYPAEWISIKKYQRLFSV